jgi:Ca2+-dependent lipid-binding protein
VKHHSTNSKQHDQSEPEPKPQRTEVVRRSRSPRWSAGRFTFPSCRLADAALRVEVWDWDRFSTDEPMGGVSIQLVDIPLIQLPHEDATSDQVLMPEARQLPLETMPSCGAAKGQLMITMCRHE